MSNVSDIDLTTEEQYDPEPPPERTRMRWGVGCLLPLAVIAVLVGGAWLALDRGIDALRDQFSPAEDYAGEGTGSVTVEVAQGDTASDIATTLVEHDVVASREAFIEAATANPESQSIQAGFYSMREQMSAAAALDLLLDPANMVQTTVTFPEGWTVDQIVAHLAENTDFTERQYRRALRRPEAIGLPDYADGNPEGYLFPATYEIRPDSTPRSILGAMVDRFEAAASSLELVEGARSLGYTPHEVVTVASLIQAEARFDDDFPRVSRVIYNRLDEPMPLQFDSTVHYAVGRTGRVGTGDEDRNVDSPYNTYRYPGLPPGPIMAPGEQALEAALAPADGPWLYFVTTNPDTGETKFAESYSEHLRNRQEFLEWCAQSETC